MKKTVIAVIVAGASLAMVMSAHASDRKLYLSIENGLNSRTSDAKLDKDIKFYFGDQKHPKVLKKLGTYSANKKSNAFGKSDENACNWAFLSNMITLQNRARQLGANAVVNITSNYKHQTYSSKTEYECHAGGLMAGVALKGDFVKIADK